MFCFIDKNDFDLRYGHLPLVETYFDEKTDTLFLVKDQREFNMDRYLEQRGLPQDLVFVEGNEMIVDRNNNTVTYSISSSIVDITDKIIDVEDRLDKGPLLYDLMGRVKQLNGLEK